MFFFKKKKDEDISLEEAAGESNDSSNESSSEPQNGNSADLTLFSENSSSGSSSDAQKGFKFKEMSLLLSDVDRLKAQSEANSDVRKIFDERISRINEEIGEIRRMIIDQQKQVTEVDVKATKSSDLVESVQPQQLLSQVTKEDVKVESIKAKLDSIAIIQDKFKEEMSELRREVSKFKGLNETLKLNEEVKLEINNIKKSLAVVDKDANLVEDIFVQVQKNYSEFMKFKQLVEQTKDLLEVTRKEFDNLKIKTEEFMTKKDFDVYAKNINSLSESVGIKVKEVDSTLKKAKEMSDVLSKTKEFSDKIMKSSPQLSELIRFTSKLESHDSRFESQQMSIHALKDEISGLSKMFESNISELNLMRSKFYDGKNVNGGSFDEARKISFEMDKKVEKVEELASQIYELSRIFVQWVRVKEHKLKPFRPSKHKIL